jgi:hypothetical protein
VGESSYLTRKWSKSDTIVNLHRDSNGNVPGGLPGLLDCMRAGQAGAHLDDPVDGPEQGAEREGAQDGHDRRQAKVVAPLLPNTRNPQFLRKKNALGWR